MFKLCFRYAFGVMIILNFVLFLLIAVGQLGIFSAIKISTLKTSTDRKWSEMVLAYRLATVVVSDFLCWFPIGVLGLMASQGFPVPGEVNVALAIFVLPLNSALNPFLYTLNAVLEKRRSKKIERLSRFLETKIKRELKEAPAV